MKLHIITAQSRTTYLEEIYLSIPKFDDIVWHIAKSMHTPALVGSFLEDKRVQVYEVNCKDEDPTAKINHAFDNIREGYFFLLDDDTIFLENAYHTYRKFSQEGFVGMIIGNQLYGESRFFKKKYKISSDPSITYLDTGMVICHSVVLTKFGWKTEKYFNDDVRFWSKCYAYFGNGHVRFVKEIISYYNYFEPKIRIRKKIGQTKVRIDINHPVLVLFYWYMAIFKQQIRGILKIKPINNFPQREYIDFLA